MVKNKSSNLIAQGTVEYLVIIAVVVVISLIVVGLAINVSSSPTQQIKNSSSKLGTATTGGISITDVVADNGGDNVLSLLNNSGGSIILTKVTPVSSSGALGIARNFSSYSGSLSTSTIPLSANNDCNCGSGEISKTCNFKINYTTESGLTKEIIIEKVVACVNDANVTAGTVVPTLLDFCDGTPAVGTVCADGTVYVNATLRTTPSDAGTYAWGPDGVTTGATDVSDGRNNITGLKLLSPDLSAYPAAQVCNNLTPNFGYNDWYLPSKGELLTLCFNKVDIGNFNTSGIWPLGYYWSSTEYNSDQAWFLGFNFGCGQSYSRKHYNGNVRCVRSIS